VRKCAPEARPEKSGKNCAEQRQQRYGEQS
jgi:hypothetical protein